jgi:hypothetical protein
LRCRYWAARISLYAFATRTVAEESNPFPREVHTRRDRHRRDERCGRRDGGSHSNGGWTPNCHGFAAVSESPDGSLDGEARCHIC